MTCKDFRRQWDELLDAEAALAGSPGAAPSIDEAEAALLAHAAECPACRPIVARYQTLRRAIHAWRQPPVPPADLVRRVLSASDGLSPRTEQLAQNRRLRRFWADHREGFRRISGVAAAFVIAALLLGVLTPFRRRPGPDRLRPAPTTLVRDSHPTPGLPDSPGERSALNRAVAEATSATWDLARTASGPAARIGREVLDATAPSGDPATGRPAPPSQSSPAESDEGSVRLSLSMPTLDPLGPDAAEASSVLQQMGDQLSAGVRPLSSTARHAFGFLLGPPPAPAGMRPDGTTTNGARSG